jgi:PAS domain S-box-containing protein
MDERSNAATNAPATLLSERCELEVSHAVARWEVLAQRILDCEQVYAVSAGATVQWSNSAQFEVDPEGRGAVLAVPMPQTDPSVIKDLVATGVPGRIWSAADFGTLCEIAAAMSQDVHVIVNRHAQQDLIDRLRDSEEVHRALTEASSQIIWFSDAEGGMVEPCTTWSAFTGQATKDILGFGCLAAIHPDDRRHLQSIWGKASNTPAKMVFDYRLLHNSGQWRWLTECAVPLFSGDGELRGWAGMSTDIQERREQERFRRTSELRYRALVDATAQIVWAMDEQGKLVSGLDGWKQFTAQTLEDRGSSKWADVVHPNDLERMTTVWSQKPSETAIGETQYRLRHHSGDWRWMSERVVPLRETEAGCIGWVGMTSDITPQKEIELALTRSEQRYRALVEASAEIVWSTNATGDKRDDSPSWRAFTGRSSQACSGSGWIEAVHPDDRLRVARRLSKRHAEGSLEAIEYRLKNAAGEWRWMSDRAVQYGSPDALSEGWVGMATDITAKKIAELALLAREKTLSLALKAARLAAWSLTPASGELVIAGEGQSLLGLCPGQHTLPALTNRLLASDADRFGEMIDSAATQVDEVFHAELQINVAGVTKWIRVDGQYFHGSSLHEDVVRGVFSDVTAQKLADERRNLLVGEIAHRGKNLLAVVQSMASVTLGSTADQDSTYAKFMERLASLARSHSLLTDKDWVGVPLDEVIRLEFGQLSDRASLDIVPILLNPSSAQSCALVIHELITNAVKHGALSTPSGTVTVRGRLDRRGDDDCVIFSWIEAGGPTVKPPTRRGFGSMLVRRLIDGFDTDGTIDYRPEGLSVEVAMPLAMIRPAEDGFSSALGTYR